MSEGLLLQLAFDASRFLEGALDERMVDDIEAIDPGACDGAAYILVQTKDGDAFLRVRDSLPDQVTVQGHDVSIICKAADFGHRMN